MAGVKPFSNAAEYTNGLNDDPGWRRACVARLKLFRKKSNPPFNATIAPSNGSIDTNAPCASGICASRQPPSAVRRNRTTSPGFNTSATVVGAGPVTSSVMNGSAHSTASNPIVCSPSAAKNTCAVELVGAKHDRALVIEQRRVIVEQRAQLLGSECRQRLRLGPFGGVGKRDGRDRPTVTVPLVVGHQRLADGTIGRRLQTAVDGRRHFEPGRRSPRAEARDHLGSNHLRHVERFELPLRAKPLGDDGLRNRHGVLLVVDGAGFVHASKHVSAARGGAFDAGKRVPIRRPLGDAGQNGDLANGELAEGLAEVRLRSGRDTIGALTEERSCSDRARESLPW